MASHQMPQLSAWAKVRMYLTLIWIVAKCLVVFLIKLGPRLRAGWPISRVLVVSYLRSITQLSLDQNRSINVPTGQKIKTLCNTIGFPCRSVDINSNGDGPGATLHFIHLADSPEAKLLLYFHGGAYIAPIDIMGQLPFAIDCARAAGVSELVCLEYTLAPELKYPGQLVQAVDALNYILNTYNPSQIILGGDSAGGHLVLSLLAHIQKPNPRVKTIVLDQHIRGAYLISPWVAMKYNSSSFNTNATRDYIRAKGMILYTEMWRPIPSEIWAEPLNGGAQFWHGLPVDSILITAGSWECFLDDILNMATQLDAKPFGTGAVVELSVGEREVHVQCALDKAIKIPHGSVAENILDWLSSRVAKENI